MAISRSPSVDLPILAESGFSAWLVTLMAAQAVASLAATVYGWPLLLAPLVVAGGVAILLWPKAGLFILVPLIYIRTPVLGFVGVYPADIFSFVIIAGGLLHVLLKPQSSARRNPLLAPMAVILVVFAISLVGAYDFQIGLTNWFRHVQLFCLIALVPTLCDGRDVRRLLGLLVISSVVMTLPNFAEFVRITGRERIFGIAGPFFPFYLVPVILQGLVGFLLASSTGKRLGWLAVSGILGLGVVASQTREAILQIIIGAMALGVFVWVWARRNERTVLRRRVFWLGLVAVLLLLVFAFSGLSLLAPFTHRVEQALQGSSNTIYIRLFLWRLGIHTFLDSPVLGIGLGQIRDWDKFLPTWRFDPYSAATKGLGAHNDFITYAAETGTIGLLAVFWFLGLLLYAGYKRWKTRRDEVELATLLTLWIPCVSLAARFFFGTHMFYSLGGMMNALYFGMLVTHYQSPSSTLENDG